MHHQPDDNPENYRSATETRERLAIIESRMADRWERIREEFLKFDKRISELETACNRRFSEFETSIRGYNITRSSPITAVLKDQQWLLIAALILGAMLGKAGINPIQWILP